MWKTAWTVRSVYSWQCISLGTEKVWYSCQKTDLSLFYGPRRLFAVSEILNLKTGLVGHGSNHLFNNLSEEGTKQSLRYVELFTANCLLMYFFYCVLLFVFLSFYKKHNYQMYWLCNSYPACHFTMCAKWCICKVPFS